MLIPICGGARNHSSATIVSDQAIANATFVRTLSQINIQIHDTFYRDTYTLRFCIKGITTRPDCNDGAFGGDCELKLSVSGVFLDKDGKDSSFGSIITRRMTTERGKRLTNFCHSEQSITYDRNRLLYGALLNGYGIFYRTRLTEEDSSGSDDLIGETRGEIFSREKRRFFNCCYVDGQTTTSRSFAHKCSDTITCSLWGYACAFEKIYTSKHW